MACSRQRHSSWLQTHFETLEYCMWCMLEYPIHLECRIQYPEFETDPSHMLTHHSDIFHQMPKLEMVGSAWSLYIQHCLHQCLCTDTLSLPVQGQLLLGTSIDTQPSHSMVLGMHMSVVLWKLSGWEPFPSFPGESWGLWCWGASKTDRYQQCTR